MKLGILARKVGMTQIFDESGSLVPVTVLDTSGCVVTEVRTKEKHGYAALQLGIGDKKPQNANKAEAGHFKKANTTPKFEVQELRFEEGADVASVALGTTLSCAMFEKGDKVDIQGITKGKGFQGPVRRYGFAGKNMTHGTSKYFRHTGSIGMHTYPGRVFKGKKMPGHMGTALRTIQNVTVLEVKPEENLVLVRGGIPGGKRGIVVIRAAAKRANPEGRKLSN